jgi:hypothetical protein
MVLRNAPRVVILCSDKCRLHDRLSTDPAVLMLAIRPAPAQEVDHRDGMLKKQMASPMND